MKCSRVKNTGKINEEEEVHRFCYLENIITKERRCNRGIRIRIIQAKKAFAQKINSLTSCKDIEIRKDFLMA